MQSKKLAGSKPGASTQKYLDIAEIRDDVVVMKDGTLRAVLLASSINFALKSEEEQEALISAYAGFLNTLEFPLQVVIQSRKLNIDNYIERLKQSEKEQTNELLKMQIADYRSFVGELVDMGHIMSKRFYVVVPFNPLSDKRKSFFARLKEIFIPAITLGMKQERFLQRKKNLTSRVDHIMGQLQSMSLAAVMLDTQSLIELYYNSYNLDLAETEKMVEVGKLQIET